MQQRFSEQGVRAATYYGATDHDDDDASYLYPYDDYAAGIGHLADIRGVRGWCSARLPPAPRKRRLPRVQVTNPGQHGSVPGGGISVTLYVINNSTSAYDLAASDFTALGFDETTTPTTYGNATFSGTPTTTATESNGGLDC